MSEIKRLTELAKTLVLADSTQARLVRLVSVCGNYTPREELSDELVEIAQPVGCGGPSQRGLRFAAGETMQVEFTQMYHPEHVHMRCFRYCDLAHRFGGTARVIGAPRVVHSCCLSMGATDNSLAETLTEELRRFQALVWSEINPYLPDNGVHVVRQAFADLESNGALLYRYEPGLDGSFTLECGQVIDALVGTCYPDYRCSSGDAHELCTVSTVTGQPITMPQWQLLASALGGQLERVERGAAIWLFYLLTDRSWWPLDSILEQVHGKLLDAARHASDAEGCERSRQANLLELHDLTRDALGELLNPELVTWTLFGTRNPVA